MAALIKWVFEIELDYRWNVAAHLDPDFEQRFPEGCAFVDRGGVRRLEIRPDGSATVLQGYAWDGCSPKFLVWDCALGVPDGVPNRATRKPKAYYASLLHDALYQFLDAGLPMSRQGADAVFLELLQRDGFAPALFYHRVVRLLGGLAHRFTRWKRSYKGRRVPL